MAKLSDFVKEYYPEPKERDRILHELMTKGEYTLLDSFKTSVDIKRGIHKVEIPCLRIHDARIMKSILENNKELLEAGMWGIATLKYAPMVTSEEEESQSPILITNFEPLQYSGIKIEKFKEKRMLFSTKEWIIALINTLGLNPAVFFFHGTFKIIGDIGVRDYVIFDEISKVNFSNPDEMIGKLKDYMESGEFERGMLKRARSGCSLMFMGNIIEVENEIPADDFSSVLPNYMKDSAFIDRIHGFIPGWELPKIFQTDVHLSKGYGFITDYFCEILHNCRLVTSVIAR